MSTKSNGSSAPARRHGKSVGYISDRKTDFSDIPELTDAELASARRVGRPRTGKAKQLIANRIAPAVLDRIVTLMHAMLEAAVERAA